MDKKVEIRDKIDHLINMVNQIEAKQKELVGTKWKRKYM